MESQSGLGRELLWGLLACQNQLVSRDALAAALEDRRREEKKSIVEILRGRCGLDPARIAVVDSLTRDYLEHGEEDPVKVFQIVALGKALERLLDGVPDPQWRQVLRQAAAEVAGIDGSMRTTSLTVTVLPSEESPAELASQGSLAGEKETEVAPGAENSDAGPESTIPQPPACRDGLPDRTGDFDKTRSPSGNLDITRPLGHKGHGRQPDNHAPGQRLGGCGSSGARGTGRLASAIPDRPTPCRGRAGGRLRGSR